MGIPPFRVKAVFDYASPHDDDLSFPNGQIVTVTDEEDADWYYGEYADSTGSKREGLFPRNFVERYEPETPPRPSRSTRPKKDAEQAPAESSNPPPIHELESSGMLRNQVTADPLPPSISDESKTAGLPTASEIQSSSQVQEAPETAKISSSAKPIVKGPALSTPKPAAPPVSEKPLSGSFRDRIAAFNKPTAPVAPVKPSGLGQSGGSGFIKKPFVAPPPSKNAYVPPPREPPQKIYRREEDPAMITPSSNDPEDTNPPTNVLSTTSENAEPEDQPKPTSLKERIALLQKQQMEQAARHLDVAQKKEKPKRPPKKRTESYQSGGDVDTIIEGHELEKVDSAGTAKGLPSEATIEPQLPARSSTRRRKSKDTATSPVASSRELFSDGNDADQSGAGDTEDGGDVSTGRDDVDEKPQPRAVLPTQPLPSKPIPQESLDHHEARDEDDNEAEEEDGEEDEEEEEGMDPEVRRRLEIRERMAKMSGGMGMAGMFTPPGAAPPMASKKQTSSGGSSREKPANQGQTSTNSAVPRNAPGMALPGMQRVRSPEQEKSPMEFSKEEEPTSTSTTQGLQNENTPDIDDVEEEPMGGLGNPEERTMRAPSIPQNNPKSPPPSRGVPPPIPTDRPVPPPPSSEPRAVPLPPPQIPTSPTNGSESEDGMPSNKKRLSVKTNVPVNSTSINPATHPMPSAGFSPTLPTRSQINRQPTSQYDEQNSQSVSNLKEPMSPGGSTFTPNRASRVPQIPFSTPAPSSPQQIRAPPPPLPTQAPPSRRSTAGPKAYLAAPKQQSEDSEEEEVTEYDGDYDTDIVSSVTHKDAPKSHARQKSLDESFTSDESSYHHSGLPSIGPPQIPSNAPRAVPPPPPNQPPKHGWQTSDMPRSAPPPPPPAKEQVQEGSSEEYDPYSYVAPKQGVPAGSESKSQMAPATPEFEQSYEDLYSASPPKSLISSPSAPSSKSFAPSPVIPPPPAPSQERPMPRQSLDVLRHTSTNRRSLDASRPSSEQGFIASDIDLGRGTQWWTHRNSPPPALQNRTDVNFEIEESSSNQQSGAQIIVKQVYALYMDYSQSVIMVRFDANDPSRAELQQNHEPPPTRLRQDQLENAHSMFGARIADVANSKQNVVVGDGTPFAFVSELIKSLPNALQPVGSRAYGALVYANLANASIQQNDEIRAGDIVSFRNAKVQGHRGPMKQKYNMEVGKPDHVGIVVDWDGTKKKIRAWEQGRESKKVKLESFKLGDLRSGEVKVWRVMSRSWVGWGGQS